VATASNGMHTVTGADSRGCQSPIVHSIYDSGGMAAGIDLAGVEGT
jgi:hypothetical protein